ncbi:ImmA/IrrE family metallo-endopeptidase, partial [Candidatus Venteria ishoeyi]|uniref:ImmA/IrrE family metallo-endopeptidase n=1 Tax=Candidatus Venteria ishoeyi TaxID=1899563 RepID=UPI000AFF2E42
MLPEENMARRLLQRHGLTPPFNLEALVSNYANLDKRGFPTDADGISIGIDGGTTPEIILNTKHYPTRQRFTLAHELGHIIIPWHTGTIVSHTQLSISTEVKCEYRVMETEANRFAAELLLPTDWINLLYSNSNNICQFLKKVLKDSGASQDAVLIKVFNTVEEMLILTEVNSYNELIKVYQTKSVPSIKIPEETNLSKNPPFNSTILVERFSLGNRNYLLWKFENHSTLDSDYREWREILSQIMKECDLKSLQSSINAVLPSVYQRNKTKSRDEIIVKVIMAYEGRQK